MKKLSNLMLIANFLSSLFYSMSYPYIYAETLKAVSTYYISFEQIITCISTMIFSVAWNRAGDKIFRHYRKIMIAEIIADIILFAEVENLEKSLDELRTLMIQKSAGQPNRNHPKASGYVEFEDLETVLNNIVIETMWIYLGGGFTKLKGAIENGDRK